MLSFRLREPFIAAYREAPPPFGFDGLGEFVYHMCCCRRTPEGADEQWFETVRRVVEGTYSLQKDHILSLRLGWDEARAQRSAEEMYERMFQMKFLPPVRGLHAMGTAIVHEKRLSAALHSCAFVSTEFLSQDPPKPFSFSLDASLLGVAVRFDCRGAGQVAVAGADASEACEVFVVPDSREGWVESLRRLLASHFGQRTRGVRFDYSLLRERAAPLEKEEEEEETGDGRALAALHESVEALLVSQRGAVLSRRLIEKLFRLIEQCVARAKEKGRSSETAVDCLDEEDGAAPADCQLCRMGMDYEATAARVLESGEAGLCWPENAQQYNRMEDGCEDGRDACLEQSLESYEMGCPVETFPARHASWEDFQRTLKCALLYAKTVTLGRTHWPESNRVMLRNRRIGCSLSGVAQFLSARGLETLRQWAEAGHASLRRWDEDFSAWLGVPRSRKLTCVWPGGAVSLLAGATPGMHFPESRYCLCRLRVRRLSPLLSALSEGHWDAADGAAVVSFAVDAGAGVRTAAEVPMFEQLAIAAFLQRHWADSQVSCTVCFDREREGPLLARALELFQYQLKGVTVRVRGGPPTLWEAVSEERFLQVRRRQGTLSWRRRECSSPMKKCCGDCSATPCSVQELGACGRSRGFCLQLRQAEEEEDGVDMAIFPSVVSFCTNAGCF